MTQSSYLDDYVSVCKILGRFHCYIDTRDRTLGMHLMLKGFWEINITECISRIVQHDMTVIDIGANYGYYSLLMAGLVGNKKGKVHSIEANPKIFQLLSDSIEVNALKHKVHLHNYAVCDHQTDDINFVYRDSSTMNGKLGVFKKMDNMSPGEHLISVKGNTLDNIIPEDEKIDFIKVDIEGAEEMFWNGSTNIRKRNPEINILMEFNVRRYDDPKAFVDSMFSEGFRVKLLGKTENDDVELTAKSLLEIPASQHVMILLYR